MRSPTCFFTTSRAMTVNRPVWLGGSKRSESAIDGRFFSSDM